MLAALQALAWRAGQAFEVDVIDVDADEALVERFDELVPVLFGDGWTSRSCATTSSTKPRCADISTASR
jgi:hypothetical protein